MCGRTACTLAPEAFPKACTFKDRNGNSRQPRWRDGQSGKYKSSYNLSPQQHSPVLISSQHVHNRSNEIQQEDERVLQSMKWGLIPSWHRGTAEDFSFKMNNARSDGLMEKKSFKGPLEKGKRCVVLADGFYEWQTKNGKKQPYFIFFKNQVTEEQDAADCEKEHIETENKRLLTMAGIFDSWIDKSNGEVLYTYSIITVDASESFKWIHHRMPAILESEEKVRQWLDYETVPLGKALSLLSPKECLDFYPVSTIVNNSRNNSPECIEKIKINPEKPLAKKVTLLSWFKKSPQKRPADENISSPEKKLKPE